MSPSERRDMIRKESTNLSLTRQCKLLKISRSSIYYTPVGFDQATIDLMHEIDRIFTKSPFFSSRQLPAYLLQSGFSSGRHHMRRLIGIMGLQAIYKNPNTSKKHPQHKIWPYLLRKLSITRPNHVWCSTLPTFQLRTASCIWWQSRIGQPLKCCPGGCQIRWMPAFALKHWTKPSPNIATPRS